MAKVFLLLLSLVTLAYTTNIKNCGSGATLNVNDIVVSGCSSTSSVCIFKKGHIANISLPFTATFQTKFVTPKVHGIIGGLAIPFPVPKNACQRSGLTCPLLAGQKYTYTTGMPVLREYPQIRLDVKWELVDKETGKDIVCIQFPVKIEA